MTRPRRSTWVLLLVFALAFATYQHVRPEAPGAPVPLPASSSSATPTATPTG